MSIPMLPTELEYEIFGYLKSDDWETLVACASVCRKWWILLRPIIFDKVVIYFVSHDSFTPVETARLDGSLPRYVRTPLNIFNFFLFSPQLCTLVHSISLVILPDRPEGVYRGGNMIDPQSLVAILGCLPNIRNVALRNVRLARPLTPHEPGSAVMNTRLDSLTVHFEYCTRHESATDPDALEIVNLFNSVATLSLTNLDSISSAFDPLQPDSPRVHAGLQCQRLALHYIASPRGVVEYLTPALSVLTSLTLQFMDVYAMLYVQLFFPALCPQLEFFACDFSATPVIQTSGMRSQFTI